MLFIESKIFGQPISRISFGGGGLSGEGGGYGFGAISEKESEIIIKASWDAGINIFDTAPIYGFGLSEERLGRYLPQEAIVVSKGGVDWHPNKRVNMSNDPVIMEKMFFESLKRLKREYIDVYMIHWPDPRVEIERPLEVLIRLKERGLIKHIGLCNSQKQDFEKAKKLASIDILQSESNLFSHDNFDFAQEPIFKMSWGTFDKGILSGRVFPERKYDASDARSWAPWWKKSDFKTKFEILEKLKLILDDYSFSLTQFALSYNLQLYDISTTLVGLKKTQDLETLTRDLNRLIIRERMNEIIKRLNHSQGE